MCPERIGQTIETCFKNNGFPLGSKPKEKCFGCE